MISYTMKDLFLTLLTIHYLTFLFWQKQNTASGMYAMLSVTRGLLFSTFKYLLKAPSYTTNAGQSTVEKVTNVTRMMCVWSQRSKKCKTYTRTLFQRLSSNYIITWCQLYQLCDYYETFFLRSLFLAARGAASMYLTSPAMLKTFFKGNGQFLSRSFHHCRGRSVSV